MYTASEESGAEDSDEDIITDYLSPLDDNGNVDAAATAAAAAAVAAAAVGSTGPVSVEGSIMAEVTSAASAAAADGGVIPTISVTQHSPAASKAFYILGKLLLNMIVCNYCCLIVDVNYL